MLHVRSKRRNPDLDKLAICLDKIGAMLTWQKDHRPDRPTARDTGFFSRSAPGAIDARVARRYAGNDPSIRRHGRPDPESRMARRQEAVERPVPDMRTDMPWNGDAPAGPWNEARRDAAIYAIGDIHGMDSLLQRLLAAIETDAAHLAGPGATKTVIFLGDAINRGPDSRRVIERLLAGPTNPADRWIVLRGNHEQAMLDALGETAPDAFARWLKRGGMATMLSYGAARGDLTPGRARALVGARHMAFLAALPFMHVSGQHLFVHAGVAPGVPLQAQSPAMLMTVRNAFLKKRHKLPYTVVHGHTPTAGAPLLGPGRIGIDSGACLTGILTALAIDPATGRHRFLQVSAHATKAKPSNVTGRPT
jgi:serine/threonine protein phosphatase 1